MLLNYKSPDAASGQLDRLEKAILSLCEMLYRFSEYYENKRNNRKLRIALVDNYCVFYNIDKDTSVVTIIMVIYGVKDLTAVLDKN